MNPYNDKCYNAFLPSKLSDGAVVAMTMIEYKGEWLGKFGPMHCYLVEIDGDQQLWNASPRNHEDIKDIARIQPGDKFTLEKVQYKSYPTYILTKYNDQPQ